MGCLPQILIVTTVTVTDWPWLILFLSLFYEAFECPDQFVAHADGISLYREPPAHSHLFQVRVHRAVFPSGDGDVFPVVDARISSDLRRRLSLAEGVVSVAA